MKKLYTTVSAIDVGLIQELLQNNNIVSSVRYMGAGGYLNIVGGDLDYDKQIWVQDYDYERAVKLLKEYSFIEQSTDEKEENKPDKPQVTSRTVMARIILIAMMILILIYILIRLI